MTVSILSARTARFAAAVARINDAANATDAAAARHAYRLAVAGLTPAESRALAAHIGATYLHG